MTRWITVACTGEPHCRHECGFAELNGKFYLFGGRRVQPVDIFDPETKAWSHGSPPPMEVHHFQPVIVDSEIWMMGTMKGLFPRETPLDTVLIYEPGTDTWKTGPAIPAERRRGASGCALHSDGWIYVVGGIIDGHYSGTQAWFDRINPVTGEWQILPDAPNKRDHAPCAIVGNALYFFGGRESGRHNGLDFEAMPGHTIGDVDVYDFTTSTWSVRPEPLPIETAGGGTAVVNDKIHYVGGESGRLEAFKEMQIFDTTAGRWSLGPSLNRERHATNCCVYDGKLWIAAGSGARGGEPELTSIECLDIP